MDISSLTYLVWLAVVPVVLTHTPIAYGPGGILRLFPTTGALGIAEADQALGEVYRASMTDYF